MFNGMKHSGRREKESERHIFGAGNYSREQDEGRKPAGMSSFIKRHSVFIKSLSVVLALLFFEQTLGWAQAGQPVWVSAAVPEREAASAGLPGGINIPKGRGATEDVFLNGGKDLIINIQDAHASLSAQYSIVNMLEELSANYDLNLVALEGGDGPVDVSLLRTFPDPGIRKETAQYLMRKGKMSAGEFFSVVSEKPIKLYGVESDSLYRANIDALYNVMENRVDCLKEADKLITALEGLGSEVYSEDLDRLNNGAALHREGKMSFPEHWGLIEELAVKNNIETGEFVNISKLLRAIELEKDIDFRKANEERQLLMDEFSRALGRSELEKLVLQSLSFKMEKISQSSFHEYLTSLAAEAGISPEPFKELIKFTGYIKAYEDIDIKGLFCEVEQCEEHTRQRIYRNDEERELYNFTKAARIIKKLFSISLVNADHEFMTDSKGYFDKENFADFIGTLNAKYGRFFESDADLDVIFGNMQEAVEFYNIAQQRNNAMIANTVRAMRENNEQVAALITGGFHSKGLSGIMKKNNLSYLVVMPKFSGSEQRPYITVLTNKKQPYEELLESGEYVLAVEIYMNRKDEADFYGSIFYSLAVSAAEGRDLLSDKTIWYNAYRTSYERHREEGAATGVISPERFAEIIGLAIDASGNVSGENEQGVQAIKTAEDTVVISWQDNGKVSHFAMARNQNGEWDIDMATPGQAKRFLSRARTEAKRSSSREAGVIFASGMAQAKLIELFETDNDTAEEEVLAARREIEERVSSELENAASVTVKEIEDRVVKTQRRAAARYGFSSLPGNWRDNTILANGIRGFAEKINERLSGGEDAAGKIADEDVLREVPKEEEEGVRISEEDFQEMIEGEWEKILTLREKIPNMTESPADIISQILEEMAGINIYTDEVFGINRIIERYRGGELSRKGFFFKLSPEDKWDIVSNKFAAYSGYLQLLEKGFSFSDEKSIEAFRAAALESFVLHAVFSEKMAEDRFRGGVEKMIQRLRVTPGELETEIREANKYDAEEMAGKNLLFLRNGKVLTGDEILALQKSDFSLRSKGDGTFVVVTASSKRGYDIWGIAGIAVSSVLTGKAVETVYAHFFGSRAAGMSAAELMVAGTGVSGVMGIAAAVFVAAAGYAGYRIWRKREKRLKEKAEELYKVWQNNRKIWGEIEEISRGLTEEKDPKAIAVFMRRAQELLKKSGDPLLGKKLIPLMNKAQQRAEKAERERSKGITRREFLLVVGSGAAMYFLPRDAKAGDGVDDKIRREIDISSSVIRKMNPGRYAAGKNEGLFREALIINFLTKWHETDRFKAMREYAGGPARGPGVEPDTAWDIIHNYVERELKDSDPGERVKNILIRTSKKSWKEILSLNEDELGDILEKNSEFATVILECRYMYDPRLPTIPRIKIEIRDGRATEESVRAIAHYWQANYQRARDEDTIKARVKSFLTSSREVPAEVWDILFSVDAAMFSRDEAQSEAGGQREQEPEGKAVPTEAGAVISDGSVSVEYVPEEEGLTEKNDISRWKYIVTLGLITGALGWIIRRRNKEMAKRRRASLFDADTYAGLQPRTSRKAFRDMAVKAGEKPGKPWYKKILHLGIFMAAIALLSSLFDSAADMAGIGVKATLFLGAMIPIFGGEKPEAEGNIIRIDEMPPRSFLPREKGGDEARKIIPITRQEGEGDSGFTVSIKTEPSIVAPDPRIIVPTASEADGLFQKPPKDIKTITAEGTGMALWIFSGLFLSAAAALMIYIYTVPLATELSAAIFIPVLSFMPVVSVFLYQLLDLSGRLEKWNAYLAGGWHRPSTTGNKRLIRVFREALEREPGRKEIAYVKGRKLYVDKAAMSQKPKMIQRFYFLHEAGHIFFNAVFGRSFSLINSGFGYMAQAFPFIAPVLALVGFFTGSFFVPFARTLSAVYREFGSMMGWEAPAASEMLGAATQEISGAVFPVVPSLETAGLVALAGLVIGSAAALVIYAAGHFLLKRDIKTRETEVLREGERGYAKEQEAGTATESVQKRPGVKLYSPGEKLLEAEKLMEEILEDLKKPDIRAILEDRKIRRGSGWRWDLMSWSGVLTFLNFVIGIADRMKRPRHTRQREAMDQIITAIDKVDERFRMAQGAAHLLGNDIYLLEKAGAENEAFLGSVVPYRFNDCISEARAEAVKFRDAAGKGDFLIRIAPESRRFQIEDRNGRELLFQKLIRVASGEKQVISDAIMLYIIGKHDEKGEDVPLSEEDAVKETVRKRYDRYSEMASTYEAIGEKHSSFYVFRALHWTLAALSAIGVIAWTFYSLSTSGSVIPVLRMGGAFLVMSALLITLYKVVIGTLGLMARDGGLSSTFNLAPLVDITEKESEQVRHARRGREEDKYPLDVTILLPVYKEENVIELLMQNVSRIKYDSDKIQVLILTEEDDLTTMGKIYGVMRRSTPYQDAEMERLREFLQSAMKRGLIEVIATPMPGPNKPYEPMQPRTKPRAVQYALNAIKGKYSIIFDAEDKPHPDVLNKFVYAYEDIEGTIKLLAERMRKEPPTVNGKINDFTRAISRKVLADEDPDLLKRAQRYGIDLSMKMVYRRLGIRKDPGMLYAVKEEFIKEFKRSAKPASLGGMLDWFNWPKSWTTRNFSGDYMTWFKLVLPGLAGLRTIFPLPGTTYFMPTALFKSLGGLDIYNVTEDEQKALKDAVDGYRNLMVNVQTLEEAIDTPLRGKWVRQRSRWIKGDFHSGLVFLRHIPKIYKYHGWAGVLHFVGLIWGSGICGMIYFVCVVVTNFWGLGLIHSLIPGGETFISGIPGLGYLAERSADIIPQIFSWMPGNAAVTGFLLFAASLVVQTVMTQVAIWLKGPDDERKVTEAANEIEGSAGKSESLKERDELMEQAKRLREGKLDGKTSTIMIICSALLPPYGAMLLIMALSGRYSKKVMAMKIRISLSSLGITVYMAELVAACLKAFKELFILRLANYWQLTTHYGRAPGSEARKFFGVKYGDIWETFKYLFRLSFVIFLPTAIMITGGLIDIGGGTGLLSWTFFPEYYMIIAAMLLTGSIGTLAVISAIAVLTLPLFLANKVISFIRHGGPGGMFGGSGKRKTQRGFALLGPGREGKAAPEGSVRHAGIVIGVACEETSFEETSKILESINSGIGGVRFVALTGETRENMLELENIRKKEGAYAAGMTEADLNEKDLRKVAEELISAIEKQDKRIFSLAYPDLAGLTPETVRLISDINGTLQTISRRIPGLRSMRGSELSVYEMRIDNIAKANRISAGTGKLEAKTKVASFRVENIAELRWLANEHRRAREKYGEDNYPVKIHIRLVNEKITKDNLEKVLVSAGVNDVISPEDIYLGDSDSLSEVHSLVMGRYRDLDLGTEDIAITDVRDLNIEDLGSQQLLDERLLFVKMEDGLVSQLYTVVAELFANNNEMLVAIPEGAELRQMDPNGTWKYFRFRPSKPVDWREVREEIKRYEMVLMAA
jgi:cellulose synthase/poly-beta-1,6-N-acetylglucosamine synthase-like glycosyltransferase